MSFLFLLTPGKHFTSESIEDMENISKYFNKSDFLYREEAKQMIYYIMNDGFREETKKKARNQSLIIKLKELKKSTIDFYLQRIKDNEIENPSIIYNSDVYSKMGEYLLQLLRFRMVIQPEIQLTVNVHKITKIKYLTAKGFWINDEGQKVRKFTKSIGRADEYTKGKDDENAVEDATIKIQSILIDEYLKLYPEK